MKKYSILISIILFLLVFNVTTFSSSEQELTFKKAELSLEEQTMLASFSNDYFVFDVKVEKETRLMVWVAHYYQGKIKRKYHDTYYNIIPGDKDKKLVYILDTISNKIYTSYIDYGDDKTNSSRVINEFKIGSYTQSLGKCNFGGKLSLSGEQPAVLGCFIINENSNTVYKSVYRDDLERILNKNEHVLLLYVQLKDD